MNILRWLLILVACGFPLFGEEFGVITFTPPEGWRVAESKDLPGSVKMMFVGKPLSNFPPSINLGMERFAGTLKEFIKTRVKASNEAHGRDWKDLGSIRTEAGSANLSQLDQRTEWGEVRMMQVILGKVGTMYILTAAALKSEFSKYYKDFFAAMKTLRFNKNLYEVIGDSKLKEALKATVVELKKAEKEMIAKNPELTVQQAFGSEEFQKNHWEPFKATLEEHYANFGPDWKGYLVRQVEEELTE